MTLISRKSAEVVTALVTGAAGGLVLIGALEYGIQWKPSGPEPGAFPFYVGVIILLASLVTLLQALRDGATAPFLTRDQALRLLSFAGPMALFFGASLVLGIYVAMAIYLFSVMRLQGGYGTLASGAVAMATVVFFYVVLERLFQVALLKGPLETWLGLH
jgi:Tripartite tricarboxylate transporter TctB family